MATKKQKRERGLAKREEYLAKVKAEGLEALRRDREYRAAKREALEASGKEINDRLLSDLARALTIKSE